LLKEDNYTWKSSTAVHYALHLDEFASPAAVWLRENAPLYFFQFMSDSTLYLEKYGKNPPLTPPPTTPSPPTTTTSSPPFSSIGPILLWFPFCTEILRVLVILGFVGMHAGIGLTMRVEAFSVITPTCLIPFIPGGLWDRVFGFLGRWKRFVILKIYFKNTLLIETGDESTNGFHNIYNDHNTHTTRKHRGSFVENFLRIAKEFFLLPQSKIFGVQEFDLEAPLLQIEDEENGAEPIQSEDGGLQDEDW